MNEYRSQSSAASRDVAARPTTSKDVSPAGKDLISAIEARLDRRSFQEHHWSGTFYEYLEICAQNPLVLRNAYQRLYDAVLSHGSEKYKLFKKECTRYHFFSDPFDNGADAIYLPHARGPAGAHPPRSSRGRAP